MCYFFALILQNSTHCASFETFGLCYHTFGKQRRTPLRLLTTYFHQIYYFRKFTKFHLKGDIYIDSTCSFQFTSVFFDYLKPILNILAHFGRTNSFILYWSEWHSANPNLLYQKNILIYYTSEVLKCKTTNMKIVWATFWVKASFWKLNYNIATKIKLVGKPDIYYI